MKCAIYWQGLKQKWTSRRSRGNAMEKVPVKFANNIAPHCPVCGSGEYMTNEDGNRSDY